MPLLLSVLQNADGVDYQKLRVKAMECAGLIGMNLSFASSSHAKPLPSDRRWT